MLDLSILTNPFIQTFINGTITTATNKANSEVVYLSMLKNNIARTTTKLTIKSALYIAV